MCFVSDNYYNGTLSNYIAICNKTIPYINLYKKTDVSFAPGYINGFSLPYKSYPRPTYLKKLFEQIYLTIFPNDIYALNITLAVATKFFCRNNFIFQNNIQSLRKFGINFLLTNSFI